MSTSETGPRGAVTLDQFIALNDELAALVRAGIPLERGLIEAGRDLRGRLGSVTGEVGRKMAEGMRLPEALAASGGGMPGVYGAVVEAGVRSGRLSEALEGMATIARGYAEARRAIGLALAYPLIVLTLAYGLTVLFVTQFVPRMIVAFQNLGVDAGPGLRFLARADDLAIYWVPVPPLIVAALGVRWIWSGRSMVLDTAGSGPWLNRVPMIGSMIRLFRAGNFASLLALLIEHRVPLDEAVKLAGDASGDPSLKAAAGAYAEAIGRGDGSEPGPIGAFPPLLAWMLRAGRRQGDLPRALGHLAESYRTRARGQAETLRMALPSTCLLVIGVGAVLAYALIVFLPMLRLWEGLALPVNR